MNNSEKFDYIIQQLKKLDQHDIYFQEIKADIVEMKADIVEMKADIVEMKADILNLNDKVKNLTKQVKDLNDYRKRNNNSIEIEVTKSVFEILKEDEKSLYIIDVSTIFPKKYMNENNSIFIEINGLILGTNDREYASKYNKSLLPRINKNRNTYNISNNLSEKIYKLYIIEGKHNITKNKVIDKYDKFNKFRTFLTNIRTNPHIFSEKFKKFINKFQLELFNLSDITLIFGTPMWNQSAKEQIIKYMKKDPNIKMITLSGNRYNYNN